ncbi:exonuclease domain-containing protein [Streptomyces sp. NBC_01615]|uniref:3'-5' exonuclease n=1 Tax=Streptomyces sp. NBC_01615 TaxID=2975898 RepID=UPI003863F341
MAPDAIALHGITAERTSTSPTFGTLLPELTQLLHGRRCIIYNAGFDCGVLERELSRHFRDTTRARAWLANCAWEDAMRPDAVWKGLWSAHRHTYRYPALGGGYEAIANCRLLLTTLEEMVAAPAQHTIGGLP